MTSEKYIGTGVAIVTPFKHGKVDYESLGELIDFLINGEVEYIVSLGSTGEASMISDVEAREIINFTRKKINNRVPLVVGYFAGNYTNAICDTLKNTNLAGIDALLLSSPAYVKPTQEGIFQHYTQIAANTDLPIIIYNVPGRTSSNITAETTLRLAASNSQFIAVKEASADMDQCLTIIKNAPEEFLVLSGDDPTALELCKMGGKGVISVIGNAYPHSFSSMIRHALSGNDTAADNLNKKLNPLHHWLYLEGNPTGIKAALGHRGLCSREVRLPLIPLTNESYFALKQEMNNVNLQS